MSRYKGDFDGYAAGLRLDMRRDPEGGSVVPCRALWQNDQPRSQHDLVVLIHGFNNNRYEAQQAYSGFRDLQKGLLDQEAGERLEAMLADAFWPGDANYAGPLDLVDFLVYPATIADAKRTADSLSAYLLQRTDVLNLSFVGHSMGCRVVLETIARLMAAPKFQTPIRKVCLLAAAVPTFALFPGGALERAFMAAEQLEVLHSRDDVVLSVAFPLGQTLAGEGFFPSAIGRYGDVPHCPGRVVTQPVEGAGHSDYWGWRSSVASAKAAGLISSFLDIASAARMLRESTLPQPDEISRRRSPERRAVGGWCAMGPT
jgi:pimeloyl-ACP methyl ester carboxylesterase